MENQKDDKDPNRTQTDEVPKMKLGEFIETNHKLLSTLGIFIALIVFSINLPDNFFGNMISFLLLAIIFLLWIEVFRRLPKSKEWSLDVFHNLLFFVLFLLALYWLIYYREIWNIYLATVLIFPIMTFLCWMISRYRKLQIVLQKTSKHKTLGPIIKWGLIIVIAYISLYLSLSVSKPINRMFDSMYSDFKSKSPNHQKKGQEETGDGQPKSENVDSTSSTSDESHNSSVGENMEAIIKWCNDNQGFIMAGLTCVYVLATIGIALLGARANSISQKNVATLTELEQERMRPVVDVSLESDSLYLSLKVSNHGQTPAYNLLITTTPRFQFLLGDASISKDGSEKQIGVIEHGIGSLGVGVSVSNLIGSFARVREVYPEMRFTGSASYRASTGKTYETPIDLDVRYLENSCHINRKTIHDVANELERIQREINHLTTGFRKPHVITEDIEHKRVADEAFIAEINKKAKAQKKQTGQQEGEA